MKYPPGKEPRFAPTDTARFWPTYSSWLPIETAPWLDAWAKALMRSLAMTLYPSDPIKWRAKQ